MSANPPPTPRLLTWHTTGQIAPIHPELAKASGAAHRPTRPMAGWATTWAMLAADDTVVSNRDRQGQTMEAAGELGKLDWSAYVKTGVWNDTHKSLIVGVPTYLEWVDKPTHPLAKAHRKLGYFTAGHLWDARDPDSWRLYAPTRADKDGNPIGTAPLVPTAGELARADRFWGLATDLAKSGRPLGFSVEGQMLLSPCGTRIVRAWVRRNAICELPVNPAATAEPIVDLLKGEGGSLFDLVRPGMIGRASCGRCTCPAGACARALPLRKAYVHSDAVGAKGLTQERLDGQAEIEATPDGIQKYRAALREDIVRRWGVTAAQADAWIDSAIQGLMAPPPVPSL